MHVLILEDEIPAFEKLRTHLSKYLEGDLTYDWGRTKEEALFFLSSKHNYDLIFADIQLLDGNSFDVFETRPPKIPIIFCSAYDAYMLEAFKSNGIAYILKPYGQQEIVEAFKKYETLFANKQDQPLTAELFAELKESIRSAEKQYKNRFIIKTAKGLYVLETDQITLVEAKGDFCKLYDATGKTHLYSASIGNLYNKLDPKSFFRINRSQLVHIKYIEQIESYFKNRLLITVKAADTKVMTSSRITADFRLWLDG